MTARRRARRLVHGVAALTNPFRAALLVAALTAALLAPSAAAAPAKVGYPSSIASTGDSITRGFNTGSLPLVDAPGNSWSTGTNAAVGSHYRRILAAHAAIAGRTYNDARTGARMADLLGQVTSAGSRRVDYVTVLMGANDVCRSSEAAMTSIATFRGQFAAALAKFSATRPDARIYVLSVPDVHRLWQVHSGNLLAALVWSTFDICQSMLADSFSMAAEDVERRQRVRERAIAYNAQLADVCARYVHCRFDGGAVFDTAFGASEVSSLDFFHPSLSGQAKLAAVTWDAGFDFSDTTAPTSTAAKSQVSAVTTAVTLTATDDVGVSGIEYRFRLGPYRRYTGTVRLPRGRTLTYRAVDVNGNVEATKSVRA